MNSPATKGVYETEKIVAYYQMLSKQLCSNYNDSTYSDVTITVSSRKFYGHKIILSMSPYFDAMFRAGMIEAQTGEIALQGVTVEAFELVLEYMYTREVKLTVDVAQDLLEACDMLHIPSLTAICATFMADHVTANNGFQLLQVADRLSLKTLYHPVKMFILEKFDHLWESMEEEIVHLPKDLLIDLIQDDHLNSKHETEVYECVMKWIEHDESRMQYLAEVFQYVRFPLLPSDYFFDDINNSTTLRSDPICLSYINEALEYHMLPSKQGLSLSGPRTHLRMASKCKDVVCLIESVNDMLHVKMINLHQTHVKPMILHLDYSTNINFSACYYNGSVYMCGGDILHDAVNKLDLSSKTISVCSNMPHPRAYHRCIVLGDFMYIIGGEGIDDTNAKIDVYNFTSNSWQTFASAKMYDNYCGSSVGFKDKIYIFGGSYSIPEYWSYPFSFDPQAKEEKMFKKLCSIPHPNVLPNEPDDPDDVEIQFLRAVVVGEEIFVLIMTHYNTSHYCLYSPATDSFTALCEAPYFHYCELVCYDGNVFVFENTNEPLSLHCYNIMEGKWKEFPLSVYCDLQNNFVSDVFRMGPTTTD